MSAQVAVLVVCIDDDEAVLSSVKRVLRQPGIEVRATSDPEEVLAWVEQDVVAVLVTDREMPLMSGVELIGRVRAIRPETVHVMLSGATVTSPVSDLADNQVFRFLPKPFDLHDLRDGVAAAIDHHHEISKPK